MYCTRCGTRLADDAAFCSACGQRAARADTAETPAPAAIAPGATESPTAYAGFWLRFAAWFIDSLLLSAGFIIILVPMVPAIFTHRGFERPVPGTEGLHPYPVAGPGAVIFILWFWALVLVGIWLYYALFESSSWQATPGKRALGVFVTDRQGRRITFARASGRHFGKILSSATLMIGYIIAGFTERKQALHDILADCLVLRRI